MITVIKPQRTLIETMPTRFTLFKLITILVLGALMVFSAPGLGNAAQTIDIARMFPAKIIDLEEWDSDQGDEPNGRGYTFTKRYHKPGETYSYLGIALSQISMQALRNDPLGPGVTRERWMAKIKEGINQAPSGTPQEEIDKYLRPIDTGGWAEEGEQNDSFRVIMEVNDPEKRLIGFFRFYNFMCFIDARGAHATYDYFDEAFRLIMERLGWE